MEMMINLHIENLPKGTLRAILRHGGVSPEEFLGS